LPYLVVQYFENAFLCRESGRIESFRGDVGPVSGRVMVQNIEDVFLDGSPVRRDDASGSRGDLKRGAGSFGFRCGSDGADQGKSEQGRSGRSSQGEGRGGRVFHEDRDSGGIFLFITIKLGIAKLWGESLRSREGE
jgi:hypothetical protein